MQTPPDVPKDPECYLTSILDITQNNRELALTLLNKLFQQLPEQIETIELALREQDIHRAISVTHILHGSVGFCGFEAMQKPAMQLEKKLIANNLATIEELLSSLKKQIANFKRLENEIISKLS